MADGRTKYIQEHFPTIPNSSVENPKIFSFRFMGYAKKYIQTEPGRPPASVITIHKDIFNESGNSLIKCHDNESFDKN